MFKKDIAHGKENIFDTETAQKLAVTPMKDWSKEEQEYVLKNPLFKKKINLWKNVYENARKFQENPQDIKPLLKKELTDIKQKRLANKQLNFHELAVLLLLKGIDNWREKEYSFFEKNEPVQKDFFILFHKYKIDYPFHKLSTKEKAFQMKYQKEIAIEINRIENAEENVI